MGLIFVIIGFYVLVCMGEGKVWCVFMFGWIFDVVEVVWLDLLVDVIDDLDVVIVVEVVFCLDCVFVVVVVVK